MDDVKLKTLLALLADLSLDADDFEIALSALKLQTALQKYYQKDLI